MKKNLTFFLFALLSLNIFACFNEISKIPGIQNGITYPDNLNGWELWKPDIDKAALRSYIARSEKTCGDDVTCSDLVIAYCYNHQFDKALQLSARLVKKYPSRYEVVMTHAAALELNGRFREALAFIRTGMRIDPHSHKDSEWIHVKILEACIAGGAPNTIIGFDFGNGNEPDTPKGIANVRQLVDQIHFQLTERYYFIPQDDPQFGALLHDYANLLYLANFKTVSREYYDLAIAYGFDKTVRPTTASLPPLPEKKIETPPHLREKPVKAALPAAYDMPGKLKVLLVFLATIAMTVGLHSWLTRKRREA